MTEGDAYRLAVERWLAAVNDRGDLETLEAAVHPTIRLERCGSYARQGQVVQILENPGPLAHWLSMTPEDVKFSLAEEPALEGVTDEDGPRVVVRYRIDYDELVTYGIWTMLLSDDGRVRFLRHEPEPVIDVEDDTVERMAAKATPLVPNIIHAHPHPHPEAAGKDQPDD